VSSEKGEPVTVAQDHATPESAAASCQDCVERTRQLVAELLRLAESARLRCKDDSCLLLYGVVEDCCLRITSMVDWRDQLAPTPRPAPAAAPTTDEQPRKETAADVRATSDRRHE
jgi:hypothetical protein